MAKIDMLKFFEKVNIICCRGNYPLVTGTEDMIVHGGENGQPLSIGIAKQMFSDDHYVSPQPPIDMAIARYNPHFIVMEDPDGEIANYLRTNGKPVSVASVDEDGINHIDVVLASTTDEPIAYAGPMVDFIEDMEMYKRVQNLKKEYYNFVQPE